MCGGFGGLRWFAVVCLLVITGINASYYTTHIQSLYVCLLVWQCIVLCWSMRGATETSRQMVKSKVKVCPCSDRAWQCVFWSNPVETTTYYTGIIVNPQVIHGTEK